ncbi:hypothetical protein D3C76_667090 [compost metagenome]
MLGAAVVPDGHAVFLPAPAHLILRDVRLADQVLQQVTTRLVAVLSVTHTFLGVVIHEVRRKGIDEQHLFAGFRVNAHDWMLCIRKLGLQLMAFFTRHRRAETRLDAMTGNQVADLRLDLIRQVVIGQHHIRPHRVTADWRALHAAQYGPHGRCLAPGRIGMPSVLVAIERDVRALVDLHQAGRLGVGRRYRVVLQIAKAACKARMLSPGNVLITQKQHPMLDQRFADKPEHFIVVDGVGDIDIDQLGTDGTGQLFNSHGDLLRSQKSRSLWFCALPDRDGPAPRPVARNAG